VSRFRNEKIGDVFIREYDVGMYLTLGAEKINGRRYIPQNKLPGVTPPLFSEFTGDEAQIGQPMPGIPVIFGNPSTAVQRYLIPCIRIKREDPSPALERWHSEHLKYRAPADGQSKVTVNYRGQDIEGYSKYEEQKGAPTTDIPYTLTIESAGKKARTHAQAMLKYCMKFFWPHGKLRVIDTFGRERLYTVHGEGPSELTSASDIRDRTVIYALSLRVQGELDLDDPREEVAVTSEPNVGLYNMDD
jgi:hypothetical protein